MSRTGPGAGATGARARRAARRVAALGVAAAVTLSGPVAVPAAVVASAAPVAAAPASGAAAARGWYQTVITDLQPLRAPLLGALDASAAWQKGTASAGATRHQLAHDLPALERVHRTLALLPPLAGHGAAHADALAGVGLYVEAVRLELAATRLSGRALVGQLQRASARLRQLGDVTYDQGTARLAALLGPTIAGADVAAARRVPDWRAAGLAPGEPLVPSWPGVRGVATGRQPSARWKVAVDRDGAPVQAAVAAALRGRGGRRALRRMAGALGRANVRLASVPAPSSDPRRAVLQRLGLLVDAEAVMAAEAGRIRGGAPGRSFGRVAAALGATGALLRTQR